MSPDEIRNSEELPDFTPLFMRYANHAFEEKISSLTPAMFEQFAKRAALDETSDRQRDMRLQIVEQARRFPMRRFPSVIATARKHKISPNEIFMLEAYFLGQIEDGKMDIPPGSVSAIPLFISFLTDRKLVRASLLEAAKFSSDIALPTDVWSVVNLQRGWLEQLPSSYREVCDLLMPFQAWKSAVVEGKRPLPIDAVSDFGFFIMEASEAKI